MSDSLGYYRPTPAGGSGQAGERPTPDNYVGYLEAMEDCLSNFADEVTGEKTPQWNLLWRITHYADGEAVDKHLTIREWVNRSIGTNSKFYPRIQAVLGRDPDAGEHLTKSFLCDPKKLCQIIVVPHTNKKGEVTVKVGMVSPLNDRLRAKLGVPVAARESGQAAMTVPSPPAPNAAGAAAQPAAVRQPGMPF